MSRQDFRERCIERDDGFCVVPSCSMHDSEITPDPNSLGEVHHIIERKLWDDGGYIKDNGATVCNYHHRLAERNIIPPQAFWRWIGVTNPPLPQGIDSMHIDKWGEQFEEAPWKEHRDNIKYPSTRHLPWSHERDTDDTAHREVDDFLGHHLVATIKMDGGNAMLVKDGENPIRARNGRHADKDHFDMAKQWYWENDLYSKIPEHYQIFGEWLYAKHSIHYGCDCNESCEDVGPALDEYFQVFGIYDTRYDLWLGWHDTMKFTYGNDMIAVPAATDMYGFGEYNNRGKFWNDAYELSKKVVEQGHEGIVIRSMYPFHYGQIEERLGKYVRPGHVEEGEKHWSQRPLVQNRLEE